MKKLIFTTLVAAGASMLQVNAQKAVPAGSVKNNPFFNEQPATQAKPGTFNKKGDISTWYSYPEILQQANILGTSGSVGFVAHDSLAKFVNEGDSIEYDRPWLAVGAVLDPKDEVIDLSDDPSLKLTRYTAYSVDSLAFRYLYCRYNNTIDDGMGGTKDVVDTLFIFSFKTPAIKERTNGTEKYANMDWDFNKRYPIGYSSIDTVLLTIEDTTTLPGTDEASWLTGVLEFGFKTPVSVPQVQSGVANNLFGFVAVFKSGIVYDTSFTFIHAGSDPKPSTDKRINYFGARSYRDAAATPYENTTFFNTSLYSPVFCGYPNTKNYYALQGGSIYTSTLYLDAFFKVTSGNVGINDIKNDVFAMSNVYPNPAEVNGTAVMAFSLKAAANVNVSIFNITGQMVKTSINKNFTAGEHAEEIDLAGLQAGIYMVNMTVNGTTVSKKLTITQ